MRPALYTLLLSCLAASHMHCSAPNPMPSSGSHPCDDAHLKQLAISYAKQSPALSAAPVDAMAIQGEEFLEDDGPVVVFQFIRPEAFPEWTPGDTFHTGFGGFPENFEITLRCSDGEVVDEYASPE
jgi:hypothetical protein